MAASEALGQELEPADVAPADVAGNRLGTVVAWVFLLAMDVSLKVCGFFRFYRLIRAFPTVGRRSASSLSVARIATAVDRAATYYFKRAWCFQRSAATVCLMRLWGLPAEMVIGISKIPFYAHAWVEIDGRVVNDGAVVQQRYSVMERC